MGDITGQALQTTVSNEGVIKSVDQVSAGVHDIEIDLDKLKKDYLKKSLNNTNEIKNKLSSLLDEFSELTSGLSIERDTKNKEKSKKPGQVNKSMTLDNILKYNDSTSASTVVLVSELQAIKAVLESNNNKPKENSNNNIGGLGKIFQGIGAGAAGIVMLAGALAAFAGAAYLFNKVQWKPAMVGLGMFALFVTGSLALAKLLGPEQQTFKQFAISIVAMTAALGLFSLAIWLVSKIGAETNWGVVIPTLATFGIFALATIALSKLVGPEKGNFMMLAASVAAMTLALALFAGAILVVSYIGKNVDWKSVMPIMITFGVFALATVVLSNIVGPEKNSFLKFAESAVFMVLALGLFAGALMVVSLASKYIDWSSTLKLMAAFGVFALATIVISNLIGPQVNNFKLFVTSIALMSLALGLFTGVVALISFVGNLINWSVVVPTMIAFEVFALATIVLSNLVGPEKNNFNKFVESIVLMTAALAIFAGVLVFISFLGNFLNWSTVTKTMLSFGIFAAATVALSRILGPEKEGFKKFVESVMLMTAALAIFAGTLALISFLDKFINWNAVDRILIAFGIFALATVALSALVGPEKGNFKKFVDSIMIMTLAFALFTGVILLISFLDKYINWKAVGIAMAAFGTFALATIGLSKLVGPEKGNFMQFVLSIGIMTLALALFAGVTVLISALDKYINWKAVSITMAAFGVFALATIGLSKLVGPEKGNFMQFVLSIGAMTLALALFAGATVLISFLNKYVDWKAVGITMAAFGVFALATIGLSKLVGPEKNNFMQFVLSIGVMTLALALFAGAAVLISFINKYIDWKAVGITMTAFGVFALATIGLSKLVGPEKSNFMKFVLSIGLMTLALALFAGAVALISFLGKDIDWSIVTPVMVAFGVFALASILLAKLVGNETNNFLKFAVSVGAMIVAFALFAGVLYLVSEIGSRVDFTEVLKIAGLFIAFVAVSAVLAKLAGSVIPDMMLLALASVLMTVAFLAFAGVVMLCSMITLEDILKSIAVLGTMVVFVAATALLGAAISLAAGPILVGLGVMLVISLALLLMAESFLIATKALNEIEITTKTKEAIQGISTIIDEIGKIKFLAAAKAAVDIIPVTTLMTNLAKVATALVTVVESLDKVPTQDQNGSSVLKTKIKGLTDAIEVITAMELHPLAIGKMIVGLGELLIAIVALGGILLEFIALSKLDYNEEAILKVLGVVDTLVGTVGNYADSIKNIGVKAAEALSIALGGITNAMNNITDIILKIKDIPIEEIDLAIANIKYMMTKLFMPGTKDDITLIDVLESMPGISNRAKNATSVLPAVTQALKDITDIILKISSVDKGTVETAIESIKVEVACLRDCSGMFAEIAGDSTVGHLWWKKDTFTEAGKTIDNIGNLIPKIKAIFENLGSNGFSTEGIESLRNCVQSVSNIDKSFETGAKTLEEGFKKIDKINTNNLSKINSAVSGIDIKPIDQLGSSISKFISSASGLDTVVTNLKNLNDALKNLNSSSKNLKNFDFSAAAKATSMKDSPSAKIAEQQVTVSGKTDNDKIIDLLRQNAEFVKAILQYSKYWTEDGMPVVEIEKEKTKKSPFDFTK